MTRVSRRLVLLHGFTGAPESWDDVLRQLGPAEAFVPALIGHDGTPGDPDVGTFEDEVDRLARLVAARWADPSHVVGYSMGGRLALGLLVRHPGLFRGGTLIGASPGLSDPTERAARARRDQEWARLLETDGLGPFLAAWEALPLFATQESAPGVAREAQRRIRTSHDPRGLARSLHVAGLATMPDYRPALERIRLPVRVVAGSRDHKFRRLAQEMVSRLPRGELRTIEGAGHNVVLERPAEIVRLLRERERGA